MATSKKKKKPRPTLDDQIRAERQGFKRVITPAYDGEPRPHIVLFKVTADEYIRLRKRAKSQKTSMSQVIRDLVF